MDSILIDGRHTAPALHHASTSSPEVCYDTTRWPTKATRTLLARFAERMRAMSLSTLEALVNTLPNSRISHIFITIINYRISFAPPVARSREIQQGLWTRGNAERQQDIGPAVRFHLSVRCETNRRAMDGMARRLGRGQSDGHGDVEKVSGRDGRCRMVSVLTSRSLDGLEFMQADASRAKEG